MATQQQQYESVLSSVLRELEEAQQKFRPIVSPHEGYAIIGEEFDEFWDEVKLKNNSKSKMRMELIQVAAMCVRTIVDCLGEDAR